MLIYDALISSSRARKRAASRERQPLISCTIGSRSRCAVVQQAHPEKLANAELAESLACFYLGGLLQALNRFLGHFVVLFFRLAPLGRCQHICKLLAIYSCQRSMQ